MSVATGMISVTTEECGLVCVSWLVLRGADAGCDFRALDELPVRPLALRLEPDAAFGLRTANLLTTVDVGVTIASPAL